MPRVRPKRESSPPLHPHTKPNAGRAHCSFAMEHRSPSAAGEGWRSLSTHPSAPPPPPLAGRALPSVALSVAPCRRRLARCSCRRRHHLLTSLAADGSSRGTFSAAAVAAAATALPVPETTPVCALTPQHVACQLCAPCCSDPAAPCCSGRAAPCYSVPDGDPAACP